MGKLIGAVVATGLGLGVLAYGPNVEQSNDTREIECAAGLVEDKGSCARPGEDGAPGEAWHDVDLVANAGPKSVRGTCSVFKGRRTVFACVPTKTPKGSPVVRVYEDGGAKYKNGSYFDPKKAGF